MPVVDASRMMLPSLVVPEATVAIAACAVIGRENCAKFNETRVYAAKLPPAVRNTKIFRILPVMEGMHDAPVPGAVTEHAGMLPMDMDPESVMRIAELPEDKMEFDGINVT